VRQGEPYVVLVNNQPVAVMISVSEADFFERVAYGMAAIHAFEIYPEIARETSELADLVSGKRQPTAREMKELTRRDPREVFPRPRLTLGISEARQRMTELLPQVFQGAELTIISSGQFAVVMIDPREYERLRRLRRVFSWFDAGGLDLTSADTDEIVRWVRARRPKRSTASESDEGSAIA
jgi:antitoxin (DNA-binding transcriptional repressor) of toxin-antitoxin stability system